MKESFLSEIRYLFPGGLDWKAQARQHRDLILVFSMGWIEAMINRGDDDAIRKAAAECKHMADPNWWPDESWRWK